MRLFREEVVATGSREILCILSGFTAGLLRVHVRKVTFYGEGIGEEWVSGWTFETKKYIIDLTTQVLSERTQFVGRQQEYTWRFDPKRAGSGVVADLGAHAFDLARWLGGEIVAVNIRKADDCDLLPAGQG